MEFERKHNKTFGRPTEPSIEVLSQRLSDTSLGEEEPTIGQLLDPKNSELYKSLFKSEAYVEIKESKTTGNLNKQYEDILSTRNQDHTKKTIKEELTRKEEQTLQKYDVKQNEGDTSDSVNKELKEELKQREDDAQKYKSKLDEGDERNQKQTEESKELLELLRLKEEHIQMLKEKQDGYDKRNQDLTMEIKELKEKLKRKDEDTQTYNDKQDENNKRNQELTRKIKNLEDDLKGKLKDIQINQDLTMEIKELKEKLKRKEEDTQTYNEKQDENNKRNQEVTRKIKHLEEDLKEKLEDIQINQDLTMEIKELKEKLKRKEEDTQTYNEKQDENNKRNQENNKEISELRELLNQKEMDLQKYKDKQDENGKRGNISEVYLENNRLKQKLEDTVEKQLYKDLCTRYQELTKETEELKKEVEQKERTIQENRVKQDGYNKRTKELELRLWDITQQLARAHSELGTIKEEKDSLITRLSRYASAQLTQDNPDVADLSDLNRPTKLAERFCELYDNEWTAAFEVLTETYKFNERDSMGRLLNIINEAYKFCLETAREQDDMLKMALFCPGAESTEDLPQSLDALQLQSVYDLRRKTSKTSLACIQQHFMQKLRGSGSSSEIITDIRPYVNQCVELCWYMTLPSPAIYIDTTVSEGDNFDKEKYRFFQTSGKKYSFTVWPALYLHKNGPLLAKGIAEASKT